MPKSVEPAKRQKKLPELPKLPHVRPRAHLTQLLIIALVLFSGFMVVQYQSARHKLQTASPAAAARQVSDTVTQVGKLMILPSKETPVVKTVVHADKLKTQPFFAQAKDGDKVLIYNTAKKAILYRPSQNIIVNVADVSTTPTP